MLKILIVEDNAAFSRSLGEVLRANYPAMHVAQAENLAEAWKRLVEVRPGLVFVDIKLQAENGLDLTRDIRTTHPSAFVAIITSHNLPEYRQAAYDNGAHCFIPKDTATAADILQLVDSVESGRPLHWSLGRDYINPSAAIYPGAR